MLPVLLDPADLATLLRTTRRAVYLRHRRGQLPAPLDLGGRRLLWDRAAVLRWLAHGGADVVDGGPRDGQA